MKPDPDYIRFRPFGAIADPIRAPRGGFSSSRRNRGRCFLLGFLVIALGLLSRSPILGLPMNVAKVAGDALWSLAVFLGIGFLWPRWKTRTVSLAALFFSFAIEFSQRYHAPWIDHWRSFRIGALILGTTFNWPDFGSYTLGVVVGVLVDLLFLRRG